MSIKETFIWIPENVLINFLRYYGKGVLSQDDDFIAALFFKRYLELKTKKIYSIGIKIANRYVSELPNWNTAKFKDFKRVLDVMTDRDHPVDFALSEGGVNDERSGAWGFQVKRFSGDSESFGNYLNSLWKKYGTKRLKFDLFIMIGDGDFLINDIVGKIDKNKFPFNHIYFMGIKNPHVMFGEIYPNIGYGLFSIEHFLPKY